MATAGDRYEERTGNIWSYSHRGDMVGLRAALSRGVCPNIKNTVGWTPSHAAASGGHTKAIRLLAKSGADFTIADRGGNLPAHQAAKNGHVHVLRLLSAEFGVDITKVRLSQAKGKATRDILIEAYRKAGKTEDDGEDEEENAPVGYARKQAKSTAFWGPRRTPISTKIKKKIIKEKRLKNKEKAATKCEGKLEAPLLEADVYNDDNHKEDSLTLDIECNEKEPSYVETVRQIKRNKKQRQKQKQGRKQQEQMQQLVAANQEYVTSEDDNFSVSSDDSTELVRDNESAAAAVNGFAALLLVNDSDSE